MSETSEPNLNRMMVASIADALMRVVDARGQLRNAEIGASAARATITGLSAQIAEVSTAFPAEAAAADERVARMASHAAACVCAPGEESACEWKGCPRRPTPGVAA